jgi:transaldolase/glucose-6-phosphate isomerase
MQDQVGTLDSFRKEILREGVEHAVLLGMGGSSLAPEVFQQTFGNRKSHPQLIVLDSTHPDAVLDVERRIDPARTLFIVSSKSGTTTETLSFFRFFWQKVRELGGTPGPQFAAITDPGSSLEVLAKERGFRRVFAAPPDVGGRYSALSVFGLVPAALIGVDVRRIVDGAWAMTEGVHSEPDDNPALMLGAALGELAQGGRDKLTITTSPEFAAFPAWIEQLVAESTGKDGKGILPVPGEPLGPPEAYGDDRVFAHVSTLKRDTGTETLLGQLEGEGHPVIRIQIESPMLLGQEFFRWEIAVAAAGSVLGIHPFNQPDVQLAKTLAKQRMAERSGEDRGWDDGTKTLSAGAHGAAAELEAWLSSAKAGDYVALQAYVAPGAAASESLQRLRMQLRDRMRVATTLGYGPRFLHSTGQLHKGGPNTGLFIQIVDDAATDVPVPETEYSFGELMRAQAQGDAQALSERGRRVLRIDTGRSGVEILDGLLG